jgi:hypothetical protein
MNPFDIFNSTLIHELSGGCGSTKITMSFTSLTSDKVPTIDEDLIYYSLYKLSGNMAIVDLTYCDRWMGHDKKDITIRGTYFEDTNNHGFIVFDTHIINVIECFICYNHSTLNTIGISESMIMSNNTSSDNKNNASMVMVDTTYGGSVIKNIDLSKIDYDNIINSRYTSS